MTPQKYETLERKLKVTRRALRLTARTLSTLTDCDRCPFREGCPVRAGEDITCSQHLMDMAIIKAKEQPNDN